MDFLYCRLCRKPFGVDDDFPNFQPVSDEEGNLRLREVPKPQFCEECDLKLRLLDFRRQIRTMLQITRAETALEDVD